MSSVYVDWFNAHWWAYIDGPEDKTEGWAVIDPALFAWRVRWFEPANNPFGESK